MKEIGGYLGMEELIKNEYYPDLLAFNTGRNALLYLIRTKKIKHINLPTFLCDSVSKAILKSNCEISYYNIDEKFQPILSLNPESNQYVYLVNYFGQFSNSQLNFYKNKYKNIIVDNTQAFFQRPIEGIDTLYSCRKYFGVPDGAYLYMNLTNADVFENLDIDKSRKRMNHILGRYEDSASQHYEEFKKNDEYFYDLPIKRMSKLTKNLLGAVDYALVKKRRIENFSFLKNKFNNINPLEIKEVKGPFAYPLYLENGIQIKKELAKRNIYIPTLWPNVLNNSEKVSLEYQYASNILPLPCDQRYEIEDMDLVANILLGVI